MKGAKNVFLYRLFAIFKNSRGQQDLLRWMGRYQVMSQKLLEAWMDMHDDPSREDLRNQHVAGAGHFYDLVINQAAAYAAANGGGAPPDMQAFVNSCINEYT